MRRSRTVFIILLSLTAFVSLLSAGCRHSWILHARLNMLVRGYPLCRLEIPPDFGKLAAPKPTGFVSAFVYRDGTYVGWLDRYGTFLLGDEMAGSQDERETKTEIILFALE